MAEATLASVVGTSPARLARLIDGLARSQLTVASAESLTGGLLTAVLTEVPGASAVVRGGLIVYATELKHNLAGIDAHLLAARGPVDPDVAMALATGVRSACGSSVGLGLTGVAGPDAQNGVPVGTWYVGLSWGGGSRLTSHLPQQSATSYGPGSRAQIRNAAVQAAVELLESLIDL